MKLNPDCIRDVLMDIEENTTINTSWKYDSLNSPKRLLDYDRFEIAYHARYCYEANLIKGFSIGGNSETIYAMDLTPKGHEFLSNIRENKIWNGVKVIAGKDKDKTGKVLSVKDGKVLVEGCNMVTKHSKPNAANPQGGIVNQEAAMDISNVMLVVDGQATRVGFQMDGDKKVRVAKKTGKVID